ncbi:lysophospholipid acyltransferase family protein [Fluviibacterium sp. S390]|uniref:lysophospholipid acyltransferase family protein n=1 Tax=Fluviibacterium sp. S390 TaxID=3415139 RepID=UPI003C7B3ABF
MNNLKKQWRRFEVRFQKSRRVQGALQSLFSAYVNFVFRTTRWQKLGFESYEADIARGVPRVLCCWHSRLVFTPYLRDWSDHPLTVMASGHADAQIASENLRQRGVEVIELATSGDNTGAIKHAVKCLRKGRSLGITVDGPFGPPEEAKPGALVIAGLAGVQAAPCTYEVTRKFRLGTWDRFVVPLPFGRGVLAVGDGFTPPKRMSEEEMADAQARLTSLIADLGERAAQRLSEKRPQPR